MLLLIMMDDDDDDDGIAMDCACAYTYMCV